MRCAVRGHDSDKFWRESAEKRFDEVEHIFFVSAWFDAAGDINTTHATLVQRKET